MNPSTKSCHHQSFSPGQTLRLNTQQNWKSNHLIRSTTSHIRNSFHLKSTVNDEAFVKLLFLFCRGKETARGLFTALFYSLKQIASELFVEKHRLRLREPFSDHHHEGTQIAWTVSILESPMQFTVTSLQ